MFDSPAYAALRQVCGLLGLAVKVISENDRPANYSFIALPPVIAGPTNTAQPPEAVVELNRNARRLVSASNTFIVYSSGLERRHDWPALGLTFVGTLWDFVTACAEVPRPAPKHRLDAIRRPALVNDVRRAQHDLESAYNDELRDAAINCLKRVATQYDNLGEEWRQWETGAATRDNLIAALGAARKALCGEV